MVDLKRDWQTWTTLSHDPVSWSHVSPFMVVAFPGTYGHMRPENMPVLHTWVSAELAERYGLDGEGLRELAYLPLALVRRIENKIGQPVPGVIEMCEPDEHAELLGLARIEQSPWIPMALIVLASTDGPASRLPRRPASPVVLRRRVSGRHC